MTLLWAEIVNPNFNNFKFKSTVRKTRKLKVNDTWELKLNVNKFGIKFNYQLLLLVIQIYVINKSEKVKRTTHDQFQIL